MSRNISAAPVGSTVFAVARGSPAYVLFLLVVLATRVAAAETQSVADLEYLISLANPAQHLLHVKLKIPPGSVAHDLQLPVWNALYQVRDFSQYVNWVRASSQGLAISIRKVDKSRWHIEGTETGAEIEYETFANDPGPFGAQLNEQHAFFNLAEVLMYPVDDRALPIHVQFTDVPSAWRIATALPELASHGFSAEDYDHLVDAPVEAGIFQESDFVEGGGHYRVVVDANPADYDMQRIVSMDRSIVSTETSWMNDRPFNTYLFIYHFPRGPAGGGMEHANSTAIDISARRLAESPQSLADTTAHEFFHLWNVKRIRPQSLEPIDYGKENYTTALWFSEGVTSTVADYALLRAGLLDESRFLKHMAGEITELEERPAHTTQSVEESSLDAWLEKYDYYRLPQRSISYYTKGELLGIVLDLAMREASDGKASLRDLFQWLNREYASKGRFFPDSEGIRQAAEAVTHADFASFFKTYVASTDEIAWNHYFNTVGLRLAKETKSVGDAGFEATWNFSGPPSVLVVTANSAAAQAGLAVGDMILEIDGQPASWDFRQKIEQMHAGDTLSLRARGPAGERDLHWKLGSREQNEFELKDLDHITPRQRDRRSAWLKGESQSSGDARP